MTMIWPTVLEARRCNPNLRNSFKSGGRSISGIESRVISDAGYWEVGVAEIVVAGRDEARAYRQMTARLRDGEAIILSIPDAYVPVGADSSAASASLASSSALRATQMTIKVTGVDVEDGHHFSIGDRLYLITEIVSGPIAAPMVNPVVTDTEWLDEPWTDAGATASAQYQVKFRPPLREAAPVGTAARFTDLTLRCVVKDAADTASDLDLDLGRLGSPSVTFAEDF